MVGKRVLLKMTNRFQSKQISFICFWTSPAEEATPAKEEETAEEVKEEPEEKPKKTRRRRKVKKEEEAEAPAAPPAPPEPSAEEKLLTEIRDLLKK